MSALQLPARPTTRSTARPVTAPARPAERHLRLVEAPGSRLAPSGPVQAWRRRIGALVVLAAVVVVLVQALAGTVQQAAPATVPASAATVVVQPGQTLWDVAVTHAPADTSTWAYVERLSELNGVTAGELQAWQVLRLPGA